MSKTLLLLLLGAAACGGSGSDSRFPSRPDGCDVHVFQTAPPMQTENIGPVSSHCDDHDFTQADCLRTLKDQVCKLGGDVVWGVPAVPDDTDGQWRYKGRAAHTK
jgi:hypothetical protein